MDREERLKAMENRVDTKYFVQVPIPLDLQLMMGRDITRIWKLRRKADYRLLWDDRKKVMCCFNPGKVDLSDDEWLDAMMIENKLPENPAVKG